MTVETNFNLGMKVSVPYDSEVKTGTVDRIITDTSKDDKTSIVYHINIEGVGLREYNEDNIIGAVPD